MAGRKIATATIASSTGAGPTSSSAVDIDHTTAKFPRRHVGIGAPSTIDGTVTVQVDRTSTGSWVDLSQDGSTSAVTVPAGSARLLKNFPFGRLRLQSSTGEASNRDFPIWLQ